MRALSTVAVVAAAFILSIVVLCGLVFTMAHAEAQKAASEQVAGAPTNPQDLRMMPRTRSGEGVAAMPNPQLSFEEVRARCLKYFSSVEYSGTVVAQSAENPAQTYLIKVTQKFATEGKPAESRFADGRPMCAVQQMTQAIDVDTQPAKPVNAYFDGVHLIRHSTTNRGSIHIVQSDGSLLNLNFFAYSDATEPSKIRRSWGMLTR